MHLIFRWSGHARPRAGRHREGHPLSGSAEPQVPATPWPRYWARSLDIIVSTLLLSIPVGLLVPGMLDAGGPFDGMVGGLLYEWLLLPLVFLFDAGIYALCGNTFGKWLAGLRVLDADGGRASRAAYLRRNFGVYVFGLGTGFPVLVLVCLVRSYSAASAGERLRWDERNDTQCVAPFATPVRLWLAAAPVVATRLIGMVLQYLPFGH